MARYCSDCTYLNPNKCKNDNKGCYKCEKIGKFMMANTPACDKFCNAYARKNYEKEVLYDEAKDLENNSTVSSPIPLILILIIIIIIKIIVG